MGSSEDRDQFLRDVIYSAQQMRAAMRYPDGEVIVVKLPPSVEGYKADQVFMDELYANNIAIEEDSDGLG